MKRIFVALLICAQSAYASIPSQYTELLPFVQESPDQGDVASCLYMSTTGAIELLLNQKYNIRYPQKGEIFDISERFTINLPGSQGSSWHLTALSKLNKNWAIAESDLPFNAWTESGEVDRSMWRRPANFYSLPRMKIDNTFKAKRLFIRGKRYAKYVVQNGDIELVKKALVEKNAPVLINYNHDGWWHMINIVGYDDNAKGECTHTPEPECTKLGGFYVRDSLGKDVHLRSYDWFRVNVNAAFSVTLK